MFVKVIHEIEFQTGDGHGRIKIHAQRVEVDIRRESEGLESRRSDVKGVSPLPNVHGGVDFGVDMDGLLADNDGDGLLWDEERPRRRGRCSGGGIRHRDGSGARGGEC